MTSAARLNHLDGDRNLRVDRLVYLLQDQVDKELRFAYLKAKRGFQPIPWRKGDEERKQKADKVSFNEAQRKINYNRDQHCDDGRLWVWLHSWCASVPFQAHLLQPNVAHNRVYLTSFPFWCRSPCSHWSPTFQTRIIPLLSLLDLGSSSHVHAPTLPGAIIFFLPNVCFTTYGLAAFFARLCRSISLKTGQTTPTKTQKSTPTMIPTTIPTMTIPTRTTFTTIMTLASSSKIHSETN